MSCLRRIGICVFPVVDDTCLNIIRAGDFFLRVKLFLTPIDHPLVNLRVFFDMSGVRREKRQHVDGHVPYRTAVVSYIQHVSRTYRHVIAMARAMDCQPNIWSGMLGLVVL